MPLNALRVTVYFVASCFNVVTAWDISCRAAEGAQPNVVVILADDQGWGDLSCHGNPNLSTPNLDKLGQSGAVFDRFYVEPVCSPTRAEFLTGRYALRDGVTGVTSGAERLDVNVPTIGNAFKEAGYATAAFGKWHNGTQAPYHPNSRGFDEFYGFCSGHWGLYFSPMLERNNSLIRGDGYLANDITNHAIEFIEHNRDKPFFAYVAFNTPHSPMQVPDRWWEKFEGKQLAAKASLPEKEKFDHTRAALAMCENLDWNVGRLLTTLEKLELTENTIVVYFSDNGPNGYRWNGEMRGIKGSTDEGGVRVPLMISWPGQIQPNSKVTHNVAAIDLSPTLLDLASIQGKPGLPIDGRSLKPLLLGKNENWPPRILFTHWNGQTASRWDHFLLDSQQRLYDLSKDPSQSRDIASKNPGIVQRLDSALDNWLQDVQFGKSRPPRPFVVGHPDSNITQLPARDAEGQGQIKRSSKHPNCSYFTNWKSLSDSITWNVEVTTPGTYRAEVYYTCSEQNKGSLVELRLGNSTTQAQVVKAFDPPLISEQFNRFPAEESPVKDFEPLDLGTIYLSESIGELTLRAIEIPGESVMDVRLLVLTRIEE
ncbi:arylsulfatase [Bythopirellula polymerisocia]|uniref:Arylsulfatase n=1 Tax=Bythopirellula polymerisocia TaxID=2528003 RepID=A0A5C6D0I1_9BACT|nr:arylsulfatase [Bythopirellula polymerisocia]TWU29251.1 Arylsulfatase precursor [Bythopirellula polymerisocia]